MIRDPFMPKLIARGLRPIGELAASRSHGDRLRIRARTARKILAVTTDHRADHSFVPAEPTWVLIRRLLREGYTKRALARLLGYKSPAIQFRKTRVTARSAQRVLALHSRLMI